MPQGNGAAPEAGMFADASQVTTSEGISTQDGGPVDGPGSPHQPEPGYRPDPAVQDNSGAIMDVFGLEGDWNEGLRASEAKLSGTGQTGSGEVPAPGAAPAADGGQPAPPAPSQPAPTPAAPAAGQPAQPAPAQPAAPTNEVETLRAQVAAMEATIRAFQSSQQPSATAQPAQPAGQPAQPSQLPPVEQLVDYRFSIPADVAAAIDSEDPNQRHAGLSHLISSVAQNVHARALLHVQHLLNDRFARYDSERAQLTERQQIEQDYYSAFPQHMEGLNRYLVHAEAQAMWAENPTLAWGPAARDALGARVNAKLGIAATPQSQADGSGQQPPTPAPSAPAPMLGTGTRPAVPGGAPTGGEGITAILSAF